jgi:hypothetical protein
MNDKTIRPHGQFNSISRIGGAVRRLLGVLPMPEPEQIDSRAERTVRSFLTLFGRKRSTL